MQSPSEVRERARGGRGSAAPSKGRAREMLDELDRSLRDMTRDVARLESGALKLPAEGHQSIGAGVEMRAADEELVDRLRGHCDGGGGETVSKDQNLD